MIKNTTAVLQKSRYLSFEQAYIKKVTSILVSTFIFRKSAHQKFITILRIYGFLVIFRKQKAL